MKVLAIFKNDKVKHEQWAVAMEQRRLGVSPKDAPTPSLDTDTTITQETAVEDKSAGNWTVPVRLYTPDMGEKLELVHRLVKSSGKVEPRHVVFSTVMPNCKDVMARSYVITSRTVSVMDSVSFRRLPILFVSLISTGLTTVYWAAG